MKAYSNIWVWYSVRKSQYKLIKSETRKLAATTFGPVLYVRLSEETCAACCLRVLNTSHTS